MRARVWGWGIAAIAAGCAGGAADDSRGDGTLPTAEDTSSGEIDTGGTSGGGSTGSSSSSPDVPTSGTVTGEGSSGETGGSTSTGEVGDSSGSTGGSTGESSGEGGGVCGDGAIDADEVCDDGNLGDGDGCNADCQPSGQLLWSTRHGGATKFVDEAMACAVDDNGSIYLAGYMTITKTNDDLWARSYTADGTIVWTQTYAGVAGLRDRGYAVVVDAAQLVYVAGHENVELQGSDVWVRKHAADGMPVWTRGYNGPASGTDVVYAATLTAAGDLLVAGSHSVAGQGLDVWIRKYDPAGATLWTRTHGGGAAKSDNGRAIVEADDGYIYVAGDETVDLEGSNAWLARYDADGNLLWERKYNGAASLDDNLYGAAVTADGGVVVCGVEKSVAIPAMSFVRKYDAAGLMVWTDLDDGPEDAGAYCYGVALADDGDVLLAGAAVEATFQRPRVRRLDGEGVAQWATTIANAGTVASQLRCVREAPDGTIVAAGGVDEGIDGRDIWVGRLSP